MKVTHCPNCQTCFKVNDEQLRLYNGKVRCGRCAFVFNALNHLLEVEDLGAQTLIMAPNAIRAQDAGEESVPAPATPAPEADHVVAAAPVPAVVEADADAAPAAPREDFLPRAALQQVLAHVDADELAMIQAGGGESVDWVEDPSRSPYPQIHDDEEAPAIAPVAVEESPFDAFVSAIAAESPQEAPKSDEDDPQARAMYVEPALDLDGVRVPEADDKEEPQRLRIAADHVAMVASVAAPASRHRGAWIALAVALLLLLGGQMIYLYRTQIGIVLPGAKPLLLNACHVLGCEIPLPADNGQISLDASELTHDPDRPSIVWLAATLRNRAEFEQALPMLELTLTDNNEQIVLKKVFTPAQYLDKSQQIASMPANSEVQANLQLELGDLRASGYRVFLFYP